MGPHALSLDIEALISERTFQEYYSEADLFY